MTDKDAVLIVFLRLLSKVCTPPSKQGEHEFWIVERDLSFTMDVIKSESFKSNPNILLTIKVPWESSNVNH